MNLPLKEAMREILEGWRRDLDADWRSVVAGIELGFDKMDPELSLAPGEPVFPARKGRYYPGAPKGAHVFHAFTGSRRRTCASWCWGRTPIPAAPSPRAEPSR